MSKRIADKQSQSGFKRVWAAVLLVFTVQTTLANPLGPSVVNGQASFATAGNTLTVTNTPGAIINWQGFSIGANEVTRFAQQSASSSVLNRVISNNPSSILGSLQSNGRVFLVNPNGIVFGSGATVDVAGLVATSLNLSNADFLAGRYNFAETAGAQNISNAGNLGAQTGGQIYLIAPNVENSGIINAPNGEVLLVAGHSVELVNSIEPNLRVNITAPAGDATNIGKLVAESGSLGLFGAVVRNSGTAVADSATMQGGRIVFKASQRAEISGAVTANGLTGGTIQALGNQVGIMDGATVTANGTQGGGTILIGGDYQGKNPDVPNAQVTYVAPAATISTDAIQNGNGGKVIIWADDTTRAYGIISAKGGANGGNGGFVEISGHRYLDFQGRVDTRAPQGKVGTLLLDPSDIAIETTGPDANVIGSGTGTLTSSPTLNAILTWATINAQSGSLIIQTDSGSTSGIGNININTSGSVTGPTTLTLLAHNNITFANAVSVSGSGDFNLIAGWNNSGTSTTSGTGTITFNPSSSLSSPGNILLHAGQAVTQDPSATITANTLSIIGSQGGTRLPGGASLQGNNMVNTLAVDIAGGGSLTFSNGQALTIGTAGSFNGILAGGNTNPINITTTVGNLTVSQPIVSDVLGGSPITLNAANTLTLNAAVTSTFNASPAGPVVLQAGAGGVTSNASGIITAAGLKVVSGGSVMLTANNAIDILAGTSVSSFQFANSKGFAVNTAGGAAPLSGLVATTGDITLKAGLLNASLNIFQAVTASAGNVTYIADNMDLAALTTAAIAQVKPFTASTNIDLGTNTASTLGLTAAELSQFAANVLRVGDLLNTASIYISAPISPANTTTLSLLSGGGVSQAGGGGITVPNLAIQAKGNVALFTPNIVGVLAGSITGTGTEYFNFRSSNIVIDTVDGVAGISIANFPNYTVGSPNGVISLLASGSITQTATGGLGGAAVWAVSNGGSVNLTTKTGGNATGIIAGSAYSGFSYKSSSPIALMNVAGNSGITTTWSGNIDVAGSGFSNSLATPFTIAGGGRWLVYASNPASVTKGGLTSAFRQYSTAYGGAVPPNGNGFIYASAPGALNVNTTLVSGTASNVYGSAPTAVFGYAIGNPTIADNEDLLLIAGTSVFTPTLSSTTPVAAYTVSYLGGLTNPAGYTFTPGVGLPYTVNPAALTLITASLTGAADKTYDGTTTATLAPGNFLLGGFVNGDSASVTQTTGTYDNPNVGSGILVSATLAPSDFIPAGSTNLTNYTLPTSASGSIGNITPAPLTVTANPAGKIYNGQPFNGGNGVTYAGLVNGETAAILSGVLTYSGTSQGAVNVGSYIITPGGLSSGNYKIGYVDGSLTITQLAVNLALTGNKVYDGTSTFSTGQLAISNAISGDAVSLFAGTASTADKNVGADKPFVSFSGLALAGASAGNYTLTGASGTGTITARPLSIWSGMGGNSLWSNPANWDALPDGSNVLAVSIPAGGSVTFDGAVMLPTLTSAGNLLLNGNNLDVGSYTQTGGSLTGTGNLNVTNSFSQAGGTITLTGASTANINQSSGNLNIASLSAPAANLTAGTGAITQTGPVIVAALATQSATGTTLTDIGNQIVNFNAGNSVSGNIALTNTGVLTITGINNNGGDILVENTGGVTTTGAVSASGSVSITAHSPITIGSGGINAGSKITLIAGTPGSSVASDIITLNGAISGGSIILAAHSVTGTTPAPAGAVLEIYKEPATPSIIDNMVSNIVLIPPAPEALAQTPAAEATAADDEKKKGDKVAAQDVAAPAAEPAPAVASLPVCK